MSRVGRTAGALTCPRCQADLQEKRWDAAVVDVCGKCRGVWLDAGELDAVIKARASADAQADHDDDDDDHDDDTGDHSPVRGRDRAGAPAAEQDRGRRRRRNDDDDGPQGGILARLANLFD